eukprot:jgi/Tetstr1/434954/TSEL_023948.t1
MPTGSAKAENQDMFQKILQVEVSYFVVAERHRKDNALAAPPVFFAVEDAHRGSRVSSSPISTGLWEGPINTVFQQDFVFPPSIVHGRLVTYTWTEAIGTAGKGRRQRAAADAVPTQMISKSPCSPPTTTMASAASTFHNAAGPDDASWKGFMLQSGAREPPPAPRGPPLRYYLTTVSADGSLNVSDGVKLNGPLTTACLREASSTAN